MPQPVPGSRLAHWPVGRRTGHIQDPGLQLDARPCAGRGEGERDAPWQGGRAVLPPEMEPLAGLEEGWGVGVEVGDEVPRSGG